MGLFHRGKGFQNMKANSPIPEKFVAMIANALGENLYDDELDGQYMMSTKSKVIAITSPDVLPITDKSQIEIMFKDLQNKDPNLLGMGESWFNVEFVNKIIGALQTYEMQHRIFINPAKPFPLLITTYEGNVNIAPVVNG